MPNNARYCLHILSVHCQHSAKTSRCTACCSLHTTQVYTPSYVTPSGGVVALCGGVIARVLFQLLLPRDGSYVLPFGKYSYDYGKGQPGLVSG
jgi:hypothetical protein